MVVLEGLFSTLFCVCVCVCVSSGWLWCQGLGPSSMLAAIIGYWDLLFVYIPCISVIFHILKMSNYFLNTKHFCFLRSILEWGKCRGLICCRPRRLPLCSGGFWECCNWRCGLYVARTGNPYCKSNTTVSVLILSVNFSVIWVFLFESSAYINALFY